mgnify:CR=1 FL=1
MPSILTADSWPLYLYLALVGLVAVQRLLELRRSRNHEIALKKRGGIEMAPGHFGAMRLLHVLWLVGCFLESSWNGEPPDPTLSLAASLAFLIGQGLRFAAMRALRERWTVRIIALPGVFPVTHGVYRYMRHPNYLAVILEIASLPLIFGCWATALLASGANALVLWIRIRAEEAALETLGDYETAFGSTRRFLPSPTSK